MKFSFFKSLTFKVTFVSLFSFFVLISVIMFAQFLIVHSEEKELFAKTAQKFFRAFESEKAFEQIEQNTVEKKTHITDSLPYQYILRQVMNYGDKIFPQFFYEKFSQGIQNSNSGNIYEPFGKSGFTLSEAIIYRTETQEVLVNEFFDLTGEQKEMIFSIPENIVKTVQLDENNFLIQRKNIGEYSVFYFTFIVNFRQYYAVLFEYGWLIFILVALSFLAVSYYFSQLVVRPIREQNISLAMYNHNLAHEIKTPLAVIHSNFEMFELTADSKFIHSSREELKNIEQITDSLLFLTNARASKSEFVEVNIVEIINEITDKFQILKIEKNFEKNEIFQKIDAHLFMSLIKNILQNAFKYSSDKSVKITIGNTFISFENNILETLTKKQLMQIEEIFYQIDNSRNSEGYGLGIPMMRKIVEIFGWKMMISSKNKKFEVKIIF